MSGWVKLHRSILENPLYFSEDFNRTHAWIDLILLANHKEGFFFKRGIRVDVKRGQVGYDLDSLGKRWGWSRGKVERFLTMLENDGQIVRQKNNVTSLISISKYEDYQSDDKAKVNPKDKPNGNKQECKEIIDKSIINKIIFETGFSELKNESEFIVKKFHSLYESNYKVWLDAKFGKWIQDYAKLKKEFGETYINKFSAIYTELAMQKMQFYKCNDFEFKNYKSLGGLLKKQKNDIHVYEKLLEISKDRYSNNQKWIDEYNANLEMFKQIKENGK
jgi:hypothetical protein